MATPRHLRILTQVFLLLLAGACSKSDPTPAATTTTTPTTTNATTASRDQFVATWGWLAEITYPSTAANAISPTVSENITISKGTGDAGVSIAFASISSTPLTGTVAADIITIPAQTIEGSSISGAIAIANKTVLGFAITSVGAGLTVKYSGTAQKGAGSLFAQDLFEGAWTGVNGTINCSPGGNSALPTGSYVIQGAVSGNSATFRPTTMGLVMNGTVSGNTLTIANQTYGGSTVQGSIKLTGNLLSNTQALAIAYTQVTTNIFSTPPTTSTCTYTISVKRY